MASTSTSRHHLRSSLLRPPSLPPPAPLPRNTRRAQTVPRHPAQSKPICHPRPRRKMVHSVRLDGEEMRSNRNATRKGGYVGLDYLAVATWVQRGVVLDGNTCLTTRCHKTPFQMNRRVQQRPTLAKGSTRFETRSGETTKLRCELGGITMLTRPVPVAGRPGSRSKPGCGRCRSGRCSVHTWPKNKAVSTCCMIVLPGFQLFHRATSNSSTITDAVTTQISADSAILPATATPPP